MLFHRHAPPAYDVKCLFTWVAPSFMFLPFTLCVISARSPYISSTGFS